MPANVNGITNAQCERTLMSTTYNAQPRNWNVQDPRFPYF